MKQETINLIKSMTEQGFLVIVDPEKLKGEDRAIIKVMACKDTDSKAEATLTVDDEQINAEIAELAGFKKEEPKPEIDLLQCDGRRFMAKIQGVACEGKIRVSDDIDYGVYLCNDQKDNAWRDVEKFGYCAAWFMRTDRPDFNISITDFELLPEHRVIFTNCVGEVFTEEDARKDVTVWWLRLSTKSIICGRFSSMTGSYSACKASTDIFRSKKSLLKYLYETCE
jgi:hypothetical protein